MACCTLHTQPCVQCSKLCTCQVGQAHMLTQRMQMLTVVAVKLWVSAGLARQRIRIRGWQGVGRIWVI